MFSLDANISIFIINTNYSQHFIVFGCRSNQQQNGCQKNYQHYYNHDSCGKIHAACAASASCATGLSGFFLKRTLCQNFGRYTPTKVVDEVATLVTEAHCIVKSTWTAIEKIHNEGTFYFRWNGLWFIRLLEWL